MRNRAGEPSRPRTGAAARTVSRVCVSTAVAIAGLIAVSPAQGPAGGVMLAAVDSPLGDGTALIPGASFIATPSQGWLNAFDNLYLQPHGFTGTTQAITTPESLYPFTGPFSLTLDKSMAQGVQILADAVHERIAAGGVDAANPIVIGGYSQSSAIDALLMSQLAAEGVPTGDLHFVLLGDPSNPNGGLLERFDVPTGTNLDVESLGLTFGSPTPSDLYPTDVYTYEYDGFADFPQYPINFLSVLNAYLGIIFNHTAYLGLTPEQLTPVADGGQAVQLATSSADSLTNYYMIPSDSLPLLDPLRLIPFIGNPLADLLQPALRVLVDLGYGSVTDGWSQGFADVATPIGFLPPQSVLDQVPEALLNGIWTGIQDSVKTLLTPENYQLISPETMTDVLGPLLGAATAAFNLDGSVSDMTNYLNEFLTGALNWFEQGIGEVSFIHTGIPFIDMGSAALFTLPQVAFDIFQNELAAGDPLDAIGLPIAALFGLAPLMLVGAII